MFLVRKKLSIMICPRKLSRTGEICEQNTKLPNFYIFSFFCALSARFSRYSWALLRHDARISQQIVWKLSPPSQGKVHRMREGLAAEDYPMEFLAFSSFMDLV